MMIYDEGGARDWLRSLPECDSTAWAKLERLVQLLVEENARQNLISRSSFAHCWQRHVADSAQLLRDVPRETPGDWLDLGTGAGFPGLVVSCLLPSWRVIMVESRSGRVQWLERVRIALDLRNAEVCGHRLENVTSKAYSVISARAFAPLPKLLDLSARFSTAETLWLLPKGRSAHQEIASLSGWNHAFHVKQSLTDGESGIVTGHLLGPGK